MAAILSVRIAINLEPLAAMRTDIRIHGFFIQLVEMCIPPFHPAFIGAKFLLFTTRILRNGGSAI